MSKKELRGEIRSWEEGIDEEPNSAFFFNLIDQDYGRKDVTERYENKVVESWAWEDILLILGWKYNISNIDQFSTVYRSFKEDNNPKDVVSFFKEELLRDTLEADKVRNLANKFDGFGEISASAYVLFGNCSPIFDQHTHRAIKWIYNQPRFRETLDLNEPNKNPGNYGKFSDNFYTIMDFISLDRDSLRDVMELDKYLFSKGKDLKKTRTDDS